MYDELVKDLRENHDKYFARDMEAADAIQELNRAADAIPHVCECCIGCEVESGSCDHAFVLSPKRAKEYLSKPRWIPVTERLPEKDIEVLVFAEGKIEGFFGDTVIAISKRYDFKIFTNSEGVEMWQSPWQYFLTDYEITHWMRLPEPPKEEKEKND